MLSLRMKRAVAALLAAVFAASTGLVTNVATDRSSWAWWAALVVLVVVGALPQIYLNGAATSDEVSMVRAMGVGAVAVQGSSHARISTKVVGPAAAAGEPGGQGVAAAGTGAVAVGGDAQGAIETDISVQADGTS